jgi:hypothetical protein
MAFLKRRPGLAMSHQATAQASDAIMLAVKPLSGSEP